MNLKEYFKFNEVDVFLKQNRDFPALDNIEIPDYIILFEADYSQTMEDSQYILTQQQYDQYAAKWTQVNDWFTSVRAKNKYALESIQTGMDEIMNRERDKAPRQHCGSLKAKERWVEATNADYQFLKKILPTALSYFEAIEGKIKSIDRKHYNCKHMSRSFDVEKGIGGYN